MLEDFDVVDSGVLYWVSKLQWSVKEVRWQTWSLWCDWQLFYIDSADKYLARPGRKQATATEDFDVHIHSFNILSDDRSKASSKTIPPHSAI